MGLTVHTPGFIGFPNSVDPVVYEFINLSISALALFLLLVFARYIVTTARKRHQSCFRFLHSYEARVAGSFALICAGEATLRGWTWGARHAIRVGWQVTWMGLAPWSYIPISFAGLEILGMVLLARTLAPGVLAWEVTMILLVGAMLTTLLT